MDQNDMKGLACLCLFGLTEALIAPHSLSELFDAQRIIFTDSREFQKIADLLSIDKELLRKRVFNHLEASGVHCQGSFSH